MSVAGTCHSARERVFQRVPERGAGSECARRPPLQHRASRSRRRLKFAASTSTSASLRGPSSLAERDPTAGPGGPSASAQLPSARRGRSSSRRVLAKPNEKKEKQASKLAPLCSLFHLAPPASTSSSIGRAFQFVISPSSVCQIAQEATSVDASLALGPLWVSRQRFFVIWEMSWSA